MFKIFTLSVFIFVTIVLLFDIGLIIVAIINSKKHNTPYQKRLTIEGLLLLLWSITLAILILY